MKPSTFPEITIVGAGFSGLILADALLRQGLRVRIVEQHDKVGGMISTIKTPFGLVETAANAFMNSARIETLLEELGLTVQPAQPASRARYIFKGGKPRRWPLSLKASFRLIVFLFRMIFFRKGMVPVADESIVQWGNRALGPEATQFLLLPALLGIYAGDGERLSASLILAPIFNRVRRTKPKIKGSVSVAGGMGAVIVALKRSLESRGVTFQLGKQWSELTGPTVFCGSAHQTARTLQPLDAELAAKLARVEMIPIVTLTLFFDHDARLAPGFGCLFPASENFSALGVLYNHCIFPGRTTSVSETWILGGALHPDFAELSDAEIMDKVLRDRPRLHGVAAQPLAHFLTRWKPALPHYTVDLERLLARERFSDPQRNIYCFGNYLGGLGLTKIAERADTLARAIKEGIHVS